MAVFWMSGTEICWKLILHRRAEDSEGWNIFVLKYRFSAPKTKQHAKQRIKIAEAEIFFPIFLSWHFNLLLRVARLPAGRAVHRLPITWPELALQSSRYQRLPLRHLFSRKQKNKIIFSWCYHFGKNPKHRSRIQYPLDFWYFKF